MIVIAYEDGTRLVKKDGEWVGPNEDLARYIERNESVMCDPGVVATAIAHVTRGRVSLVDEPPREALEMPRKRRRR